MKKEPVLIGVDVGGTSVKLGLVRGRRILADGMLTTREFKGPADLERGIAQAVLHLAVQAKGKVQGVGIGIPGLVRYPEGIVRTCANIRGWRDVPLKRNLQRRLRMLVQVDNDVNAMTLGEWRYGAGRGTSDLVCVTLGTGVGGGLILGGRMHRGWTGSAGEIGHLSLSEEGPICPCGGMGCLEREVGNKEIVRWVRRKIRDGTRSRIPAFINGRLDQLTPEIISKAAAAGDLLARQAWRHAGRRIGLVLAGVINLLNPQRVVVGGGIAQAGLWLFGPIRQTVRERAMQGAKKTPIVPAQLGSHAGIIGAAVLIHQELSS